MEYGHIVVQRPGDFATITMNRPQRRDAMSLDHVLVTALFRYIGGGEALATFA